MADKLDIIIAQQSQQSTQLASILSLVGEHTAEIRGLREGIVRVEGRIDSVCKAGANAEDAAVSADIAAVIGRGKVSNKLLVLIISAVATAAVTALGAVFGAQ